MDKDKEVKAQIEKPSSEVIPKPEKKKRGRKPKVKPEQMLFKIVEGEVILEFP